MRRALLPAAIGVLVCAVAVALTGDSREVDLAPRAAVPAADPGKPFSPRLRVEQRPSLPGQRGEVLIDVTQQEGEALLESARITAPEGVRLDAGDSGSVGEVEAVLHSPGGEQILRGRLTELQAGGEECGEKTETVLWTMLRSRTAGPVELRLAAGLAAGGPSPALTLCPAPAAGAARTSLRRLTLRLPHAQIPGGIHETVWHGSFVRAGSDGPAAESRAIVPVPSFLTLESPGGGERRPGERLQVSGYLLQADPQVGRRVRLMALSDGGPATLLGRARTTETGSYSLSVRLPATTGRVALVARAQSFERPCESGAAPSCVPTVVSGVSSPPLLLAIRP